MFTIEIAFAFATVLPAVLAICFIIKSKREERQENLEEAKSSLKVASVMTILELSAIVFFSIIMMAMSGRR